jgi:hypothetical protein
MKIARVPNVLVVAIILGLFAGCETTKPMQTGLQQQAYQSRDFAATKRNSFDAVLTVLQDYGYIIESADFDTGFITGKAPTSNRFDPWWGPMNEGGKATAFVTTTGEDSSRIRLNFVSVSQRKSAWNLAQDVINEQPVTDPAIYSNVFEKVDETIFVFKAQKGI